MVVWIVILWLGASLMACWSFSLFVRLVSELFARKRKRLIAQRSRRALWVGFGLILVCAVVAAVFGYLAYTNAANYPETEQYAAPVYAISGSLVLFGLMMFVGASIGDRPRGRVRCPKCWYDMSAASGLQCPECGRTAKSSKQFSKAKRRRWAFVLGMLLIGTGAYGVSVSRRVVETDWLAAVPSWFLMAGWEWLPEDWILAENSVYESTLQQRFDYAWKYHKPLPWIHRTRGDRFGRNLCRGLLEDQESRWDTKRLKLISSTSERVYQEDVEWVRPPIDACELYVASVDDMISAMNAESPSILQLNILEQSDDNVFTRGFFSPNDIARTWITNEINQQQSMDQTSDDEAHDSVSHIHDSPIVIERLTSLLEPYRERILTERFLSLLTSRNREATYSSLQIVIDAGLLDHAQHAFLDPAEDPEKTTARKRAMTIGFFSTYLSDAGNQQFYGTLMRLLNSSQERDLVHALNIIYRVQEYQQLNENSALLQYNEAINLAVERSIDRAGSPPAGTAWFYESYHQLALALLYNHDVDGDRIYPFIVQQLLNDPRNALYLNKHDAFSDTNFIKAWMENFAPLVDSDDVAVREWVIINLPVALGSLYDDAIDQIAVRMLDDPERHIAFSAKRKLEQRFAEILILH